MNFLKGIWYHDYFKAHPRTFVFGLLKRLFFVLVLAASLGPARPQARAKQPADQLEFSPQVWFDAYNQQYWLGALPAADVQFREDNDTVGMTRYDAEHKIFRISISEKYNVTIAETQMTILHEECHVATWTELEQHGPRWQACMHSLAARGAFDKLW